MHATAPPTRERALYAILTLVVIAAGLASRKYSNVLPAQFGKYPGDALWALMMFLLVGFVRPKWPVAATAASALAISFAVEFSQIYQAPWINAVRQTTLGHLVLGSGFHAQDLAAYALGVAAGAAMELLRLRFRAPFP